MLSLLLASAVHGAACVADGETTVRAIATGKAVEGKWPGLGWLVGPTPGRAKLYAAFAVELTVLGLLQYFAGANGNVVWVPRGIAIAGHAIAAYSNSKF